MKVLVCLSCSKAFSFFSKQIFGVDLVLVYFFRERGAIRGDGIAAFLELFNVIRYARAEE